MTARGCIIIAAHNESRVIGRCLTALQPAAQSGVLDVIVVCNGCLDDTADIARSFAGVRVLELSIASKVAALRAGDLSATPGPRIYLDADIVMTCRAALDIVTALETGPALAGRPPLRFESRGAQWLVRRWYRVRAQLPSIHNVLWGAGTYALSVAGRARFIEFPDIVSDDLFIDSLVTEHERVIVQTDPVVVRTPKRAADLLRILKRTYRTQDDVPRGVSGGAVSISQRGQLHDVRSLIRRDPGQALDVVLYVAIIALARAQARFAPGNSRWERDSSSREA